MSREHRAPMCCCCRKPATFAKSEQVGSASEQSGLVTLFYCTICSPQGSVKLPANENSYDEVSGLFDDLTDTLKEVMDGESDTESLD